MKEVEEIKQDFPFFRNNPEVCFLDSAASSLTPRTVIEAVSQYYEELSVNIHRGVYRASMKATQIYEGTRDDLKKFLNSPDEAEVIYVRNATEGFNLLAYSLSQLSSLNLSDYFSWSNGFSKGDVILISESEHHANIVPWQMIAKRHSLSIEYIPIVPENGTLDQEAFFSLKQKLKNQCVKIISLSQISNVTGIVHDLSVFRKYAREKGALFIVDGAQSVCHIRIDLKKLDPDFFIFSGHKMLGPSGIGILWGKKKLLDQLPPFMGGGDMILSVSKEKTIYNAVPHRFEAGTPDISGVFGLRAAVQYLNDLSIDEWEKKEKSLTLYTMKRFHELGLQIFGPSIEELEKGNIRKIGVISFNIDSVHSHDAGTILDEENIAIRVGHHCCQILMKAWNVPSTCRASLYIYNDTTDIDCLVGGVLKVREILN